MRSKTLHQPLSLQLSRRKLTLGACGLGLAAAVPVPAYVVPFPSRPVTLIVPFPPGGATDAMARFTATRLARELGVPTIVDNRPGAGGAIGAMATLNAPRDGYTLLFATGGTLVFNPFLYKQLKYHPLTDFDGMGVVASATNVLVVNPASPIHSVSDLIQLAKASPGKLSYGSAGIGTSSQLSGALFDNMTGTHMLHVPYRGSAAAMTDLVAGRVDILFDTASTHAPFVKAGRERALAVTSLLRSSVFPQLPTVSDSGVPGYDVSVWYALVAPKGLPSAVLSSLNAALDRAWKASDIPASLADIGFEPMYLGPSDYRKFLQQEYTKWRGVIGSAGIEAQE